MSASRNNDPGGEREALAGLADVPWNDLQHAYGSAGDVPELLRNLLSPTESVRSEALDALLGTIWHQGTVYSSSAYAVPFLARIAALSGRPDRYQLIGLLECLAKGTGYVQVHRRFLNRVESEAELDASEREEERWVRAARDAVLREVGRFAELLSDADAEVRRAIPRLLATCHEAAAFSVPELTRRLSVETDDLAASSMLLALGQLGRWHAAQAAPENVATLVEGPTVRLARVVAHALAIAPRTLVDTEVDEIVANLDGIAGLDELVMWTEGDTCEFLLTGLVGEQPRAALRLASAISQRPEAKLRSRAASVVADVVRTYRSATTNGVQLLANALADPDAAVRATAARELGSLAPVSAPTADQLLDVLRRDDGEPRWRAAVALSRLRDPRVLPAIAEELRRPTPAAWTGEALKRLGPVAAPLRDLVLDLLPRLPEARRTPAGNQLIQLTVWLGSLGPLAAPAVPVLAAMLRQGRAQVAAAGTLVSLGSAAAPARADLAALLYTDDPFLRVHGAMALWHIDGRADWLLHVADEILDRPRGAVPTALGYVAEVGPPAAPLLPRLTAQLGHSDEWHRVSAARAAWRIGGDASLVAPVLVAAAGPQPAGLRALETLLELPPAAARPLADKLRGWLEADRLPGDLGSGDETVADDERLMALCHALLERLGPNMA